MNSKTCTNTRCFITQAAGNETGWIAHSQGGAIFAEGVRYLLNGQSSYALHKIRLNGIRNPEKGELLNKQSVAFHANANNNLRSKPLFSRAGIKVLAIRANDYDMVPNIIGMNTLMRNQKTWNKNMENGPGKGRGIIQKALHKTGQAVSKTIKPRPNYLP